MVKRDPDDLVSALSKHLKAKNNANIRITIKRGGLWQPQFAKAHSRIARKEIRDTLQKKCAEEDQEYPLQVRYKANRKNKQDENIRFNAQTREGKGQSFIDSVLSVFRYNFFNKKNELEQKKVSQITKPNPESKTTLKKKLKKAKNKERKIKRKEIQRRLKKEKVQAKQQLNSASKSQ